jgi:putative phosphonate catabolism associated alcohol dehydrogenase
MNMSQTSPLYSSTCRAAVFVGAHRPFELRDFPRPTPASGEVLVRVECCTICGSDLHTITGARTEATPSILGHEAVGFIEAMGDPPLCDVGGRPLQVHDRVTWSTAVSCGTCDRCQRGLPQKCRTLAKYGHELAEGRMALSGGLSEFVLLRAGSAVVRIAEAIPAEVICPVNCATATIAAALRVAGAVKGRSVLILGAGMLGLTATAISKSGGAKPIAVCDTNSLRLNQASRFGANSAVQWQPDIKQLRRHLAEQTGVKAFDIVLELSGAPDAVETACALGDVGARIVLVGTVMKSRPVQVDPESIVRRCLSIHGMHNYAPADLQSAVAFLEVFGCAYPFAELVEHTFSLDEINQAVDVAVRNRPIRIAIRP